MRLNCQLLLVAYFSLSLSPSTFPFSFSLFPLLKGLELSLVFAKFTRFPLVHGRGRRAFPCCAPHADGRPRESCVAPLLLRLTRAATPNSAPSPQPDSGLTIKRRGSFKRKFVALGRSVMLNGALRAFLLLNSLLYCKK